MLGHVLVRLLAERGHQVTVSEARYAGLPDDPLIEAVRSSGCSWIVNAAGRIKQKSSDSSDLFVANSLLPVHLRSRLRSDQSLVHASTDCVFSGRRGGYMVGDDRDAEDVYGLSKVLGETIADHERCTVIRTSIIGPERGIGHGLMGWFLRQHGRVQGFTDHMWNGITTLEWAVICARLIEGEMGAGGRIIQPGVNPALSKHQLLGLIAEIWEHPVKIEPRETGVPVDRTLVPTLPCADLGTQLTEMRDWYREWPTQLAEAGA
jgi:dTDP-4-dehydrorhamnose reductase